MRNTYVGWWLAGVGVVVAVTAWAAYAYGRSQWENDFSAGSPYNATPFAVAAIVGGVLWLSGVIFLATGNQRTD